MTYPSLCIVDTNVAIVANLARTPDSDSDVPDECVSKCLEAIKHITASKGIVLDAGDEILSEYMQNLAMSGQPGAGDAFMKWVFTHCWSLPSTQRVCITKNGASYDEFPTHKDLQNFDISDRKFVAVANAHSDKPAILQATDCKWCGWQQALNECGISVNLLCEDYVQGKFKKKIG